MADTPHPSSPYIDQESTFFLVRQDVADKSGIQVMVVESGPHGALKRGLPVLQIRTHSGRTIRIGAVHAKAHDWIDPGARVEELKAFPRICQEHNLEAILGIVPRSITCLPVGCAMPYARCEGATDAFPLAMRTGRRL